MHDGSIAIGRRFAAIRPYLSEYQRRLWLGAEAAEWGAGGVAMVSAATGVAATTIRRGQVELAEHAPPGSGRSRRPGGGRKSAEVHDQGLVGAFDGLIEPGGGRAARSPLRWTTWPVRTLTDALQASGHPVSEFVVRRLLHQAGYTAYGTQRMDPRLRSEQFGYVNDLAAAHLMTGDPVIMVRFSKQRCGLATSDVADAELGRDALRGNGSGDVGVAPWSRVERDPITTGFALDAMAAWWQNMGRMRYATATRMMVCTVTFDSDGYRPSWMVELASLAERTGLVITSSHLPSGTWRLQAPGHRVSSWLEIGPSDAPSRHEAVVQEIRMPGSEGDGDGRQHSDHHRAGSPSEAAGATRHGFNSEWNITAQPRSDRALAAEH